MAKRKFQFVEGRSAQRPGIGTGNIAATRRAPIENVTNAVQVEGTQTDAHLLGGELFVARQQPLMGLADELIYLLHTAAEIEHSLMVQYLYSAYSLPMTSPHENWRETLVGIAREEMGHLMAVQNMLLALGGPLNLEREDYPFNVLYPFRFSLRPLSVQSLAMYVLAEMPDPEEIPASLGFDLHEVQRDAWVTEQGNRVNRVGALFRTLVDLAGQLTDDRVHRDSLNYQAAPDEWQASRYNLALTNVASAFELGELLNAIGEQGEGPNEPQSGLPSHFRRFFALYKEVKTYAAVNGQSAVANAVPENPTVNDDDAQGFLDHPDANAWGDIFNHRFRCLLVSLAHHLGIDSEKRETRDVLRGWTFEEMFNLRDISEILAELPQNDPLQIDEFGRPRFAGAPFELPYTLNLPSRPIDVWRYQEILAQHGLEQLEQINSSHPLVEDLKTKDAARLIIIRQMQETLK